MKGLLSVLIAAFAFLGVGRFGQAVDYFVRADKAFLEHRNDAAISDYLKALDSVDNRNVSLIWDDLGFAFLKRGEPSKASGYLELALSAFPDDYDIRLYLAGAYFLDSRIDKASAHLDEIAANIHFDASWLESASELDILNEYGDRIPGASLRRLRLEKGILLKKNGPAGAALIIDAFNEKNEGLFHCLRGLVLRETVRNMEAAEELALAAESGYERCDPHAAARAIIDGIDHRIKGHPQSWAWLAQERSLEKLERGELKEAIGLLEEGLRCDQASFTINHNLALLKYDVDELDAAEAYCARALWFRERNAQDHDLMGNIYFRRKAFERALDEFQRAVELDENDPGAHYNVGSVFYALGNSADAETFWNKAIECEERRASQSPELSAAGSRSDVLKYSLKVVKRPVSFLAHGSLGKLYLEQSLLDRAIDHLKKAIELVPGDADSYLPMARALIGKGLNGEATGYLNKYVSLGGKDGEEATRLLKLAKKIP